MKLFGYDITKTKAATLAMERVQAGASASGEQQLSGYIKLLYQSPTLASCISVWSMTLNEAPIKINIGKLTDQHHLAQLFRKPNSYQSQSELFKLIGWYCGIGGNAYLHKVRDGLGRTVELHCYNDAQIQPISKGTWIDHYLYNFNNQRVEIAPSEIVHFRSHLISPTKPYLGLSPAALVGRSALIESALADVVSSTMNNGGIPPSTLKYKGQGSLNTDQIENVKDQYKQHLLNKNKGKFDVLLLPADIDKIQEANLAEMQMSSVWSKSDVDICGAYRVPVQVAQSFAALGQSTYNNVREAYRQFTELTRIPLWNMWEEEIQRSFADEYANVDVEFDTSMVAALQPDSTTLTANILLAFEKGIATQNEARSVLNLPPLPDGDTIKPATPTVTLAAKNFDADNTQEYVNWSEEKKVSVWQKYDDINTQATVEIADAVSKSFDGLETEIVRGVKKAPFDYDKWAQKLIKATEESRGKLIRKVIGEAWKDAGALDDLGDAETNIYNKAATESAEKIKESIGTIRDEVKELLAKNAGRTEAELIELLKNKFATLKESRANLIGRTTATSASGGTKQKIVKEYNDRNPNKQLVRVWLSSRDASTRESHLAADGQREDEDGFFTINGYKTEYPAGSGLPASEACNCHCTTITQRVK